MPTANFFISDSEKARFMTLPKGITHIKLWQTGLAVKEAEAKKNLESQVRKEKKVA